MTKDTTAHQNIKQRKHVWLIGAAVLICALLCVGLAGIWLYSGKATSAKLAVFRASGLPVGKVGDSYVSAGELEDLTAVAPVLEARGETAEQVVRLRGVAEGKVSVSGDDLDRAEKTLADDTLYGQAVRLAGKHAARQTVVQHFVLETKLKAWYASQPALEPAFTARVAAVEQALAHGASFADTAERYSEDTATKWFSGDTGYLEVSTLVPEYAAAVLKLSPGERKTVYTRYGAHVLELKDKKTQEGKTFVRVQEIVVRPEGFEAWLAREEAAVPVVWYAQ